MENFLYYLVNKDVQTLRIYFLVCRLKSLSWTLLQAGAVNTLMLFGTVPLICHVQQKETFIIEALFFFFYNKQMAWHLYASALHTNSLWDGTGFPFPPWVEWQCCQCSEVMREQERACHQGQCEWKCELTRSTIIQ